jgi:hypothetical protein
MINELDALTLESVGAPFEDTNHLDSLALSLDCALLTSASRDGIKTSSSLHSTFIIVSPISPSHPTHDNLLTRNSFNPRNTVHPRSIYATFHPTSLLGYGLNKKQSVCICPHTSTSLVLISSYRPLNVNVHSSLINSMQVIMFVHLSLLLILHLLV